MEIIRKTSCGEIRGTTCQWPGVEAYKGIRYASAGRFEYPRMITSWEGIYDASQYGSCCYQPRSFYDESLMQEKAFYYHEFREGEQYTYSEDCLFLNIWTPENAGEQSHLPVIFYVHGGGFTGGCGHEKHFDGPVWSTQGVVSVTINYRLGPLGFACIQEAEQEAGHTGNYGLFDQLTALQWVRANISAFGGDPDNITIMGQSAGAMSVQQLVLSPLAKALPAKAVMSSGGGVSDRMFGAKPAADYFEFWNAVMKEAGCAGLEEFRKLEPEKLFASYKKAATGLKNAMPCCPVLDGVFVTDVSFRAAERGEQAAIPYMMGSTSEDIAPPFIFKMAKNWCRLQADQKKAPSYAYFFDRQLPGDKNGAWHSSDLWYWFGTLDHCWRPFTKKDREISEQMVHFLINFAYNGDPNGKDLPEWQPIGKGQNKVLRIGEKDTHMGGVNMAKLTHTMLTNHAVGE